MAGLMRARDVRTSASSKTAPATILQVPLGARFFPRPALITRAVGEAGRLVVEPEPEPEPHGTVAQYLICDPKRLVYPACGATGPRSRSSPHSGCRQRVTVFDYPDGRLAIKHKGLELPYRTFDKRQRVNQAA